MEPVFAQRSEYKNITDENKENAKIYIPQSALTLSLRYDMMIKRRWLNLTFLFKRYIHKNAFPGRLQQHKWTINVSLATYGCH